MNVNTVTMSEENKPKSEPMAKKNWTIDENTLLKSTLALYRSKIPGVKDTEICWNIICKSVTGRTNKQCRERYFNHLRKGIKKGPWSDKEIGLLMHHFALTPRKWAFIAKKIEGRSDNSVKNKYHSLAKKFKNGQMIMTNFSSSNSKIVATTTAGSASTTSTTTSPTSTMKHSINQQQHQTELVKKRKRENGDTDKVVPQDVLTAIGCTRRSLDSSTSSTRSPANHGHKNLEQPKLKKRKKSLQRSFQNVDKTPPTLSSSSSNINNISSTSNSVSVMKNGACSGVEENMDDTLFIRSLAADSGLDWFDAFEHDELLKSDEVNLDWETGLATITENNQHFYSSYSLYSMN